LGTDQGQRYLYVVNDNDEIVYRRVKAGMLTNGRRVIEDGLKPGERVVVNGLQRVRPGDKVTTKLAETIAPDSSISPVSGLAMDAIVHRSKSAERPAPAPRRAAPRAHAGTER